jgi:hypothetical protein
VVQNTIASQLKIFILGSTGNIELNKELLHKNSNFMIKDQGKTGCGFLRKIMDYQKGKEPVSINFVSSILAFEDRFLDPEDKDFLVRIIKSLAKGNRV